MSNTFSFSQIGSQGSGDPMPAVSKGTPVSTTGIQGGEETTPLANKLANIPTLSDSKSSNKSPVSVTTPPPPKSKPQLKTRPSPPTSKPRITSYYQLLKRAQNLYNQYTGENLDTFIDNFLKDPDNRPQKKDKETLDEWVQKLKNDMAIIQLLEKDNTTQTYKKSNNDIIKELAKIDKIHPIPHDIVIEKVETFLKENIKPVFLEKLTTFNGDLSQISAKQVVEELTEFCNNYDIGVLTYDPATLFNFLQLEASLFSNSACQNPTNKYIEDCTLLINAFSKNNWSSSGKIINEDSIDFAFKFIIENLANYRNSVTKELNRLKSANATNLIKETINALESFFKVGNEILNNDTFNKIYTNTYIEKFKKFYTNNYIEYFKQFYTNNHIEKLKQFYISNIFKYNENDNFVYEFQNELQKLNSQDVTLDYIKEAACLDWKNLSKYILYINADKNEVKINLKTLFIDNVLVQDLYFIKAHNNLNTEDFPNLYWLTTFLYINHFRDAEDELNQNHCLSLHLSETGQPRTIFPDSSILKELLKQKDHYSDEFFLSTLSKFDLSNFADESILQKILYEVNQIDLQSFDYSKNIDFFKSFLKVFSALMTNSKNKLTPKTDVLREFFNQLISKTDVLRKIFKQLISKEGDDYWFNCWLNKLKNDKTIYKEINNIISETLETTPNKENGSSELPTPSIPSSVSEPHVSEPTPPIQSTVPEGKKGITKTLKSFFNRIFFRKK